MYLISDNNNKYLHVNNIIKVKDLDISNIEEFLWILSPVGFNLYNIRSAKYRNLLW